MNNSMQISVEAIFIDLDGTLLASDLSVSERCATSLRRARETGVRVFLASGRHATNVAKLVEALQVDPYALVSNGCALNVATGEAVFFHPFSRNTWVRLANLAQRYGASPIIHAPTEWFIECIDENIQLEISRCGITPTILKFDRVTTPIIKVLIIGDESALSRCQAELRASRCPDIDWFTTFPEYLEVMPAGASKGKARDALLELLNIPKDKVMAIGDGSNDVAMLSDIGISVAVANARDSVLRIADYIAPSNDEGGVAVAIEAFVLGQQAAYNRLQLCRGRLGVNNQGE
jgi:Cof subfamily protein (haloacid dehalogenase superfamily)